MRAPSPEHQGSAPPLTQSTTGSSASTPVGLSIGDVELSVSTGSGRQDRGEHHQRRPRRTIAIEHESPSRGQHRPRREQQQDAPASGGTSRRTTKFESHAATTGTAGLRVGDERVREVLVRSRRRPRSRADDDDHQPADRVAGHPGREEGADRAVPSIIMMAIDDERSKVSLRIDRATAPASPRHGDAQDHPRPSERSGSRSSVALRRGHRARAASCRARARSRSSWCRRSRRAGRRSPGARCRARWPSCRNRDRRRSRRTRGTRPVARA